MARTPVLHETSRVGPLSALARHSGSGAKGWISTTSRTEKRAHFAAARHGSDASLPVRMASVARHHIEYSRNRCSASPTALGFAR
jgi:hypothetical protein